MKVNLKFLRGQTNRFGYEINVDDVTGDGLQKAEEVISKYSVMLNKLAKNKGDRKTVWNPSEEEKANDDVEEI